MKFNTLPLPLVAGASVVAAFPQGITPLAPRTYPVMPPPPPVCDTGMVVTYIVQPQDTLSRIAGSLLSATCNIAQFNKIANVDLIFGGQLLLVPIKPANPDNDTCLIVNDSTAICVTNGPATYVVQDNDIFKSIAKKLGITTEALMKANSGVDQFSLVKNMVLQVPVCGAAPPS